MDCSVKTNLIACWLIQEWQQLNESKNNVQKKMYFRKGWTNNIHILTSFKKIAVPKQVQEILSVNKTASDIKLIKITISGKATYTLETEWKLDF